VLGSAAGGGLPQWNCNCTNCQLARKGEIAPQSQSSIALSGDGKMWWLVNASPDLPAQIESFGPLRPRASGPRNSPIAGVFLTNADIDHVLGLVLMRQRETPLAVYTAPAIRNQLHWLDQLVGSFCPIEWRQLPAQFVELCEGIQFRASDLARSLALQFKSRQNRRVLIAPAVSAVTGELVEAIRNSDAVLFDGTFWSNDELSTVRPGSRSAVEMGHMPVERSLTILSESNARRKIYIHINNTNPILTPDSPQRRTLKAAGLIVGYDGLQFEL
jgi:pyrroloquinoline quinone biosynthesis protein B